MAHDDSSGAVATGRADADTLLVSRAVDRGLIPPEVAIQVTQMTLSGASASDVLVQQGHLTQKLVERLMTDPDGITQTAPSTHATLFDASLVAIPGYTITGMLGRGGMGAVYAATQESLSRPVALKIIGGDLAKDPEFADRFLREARAAGAVNHPNVITCYDVGRHQDRLYMALELAQGGDASALMRTKGGRLSENRVLRIGSDCARGLVAIARAGLIHRDIKPSNIFISEDGSAKLADLGLARSTTGDDRMTVTGRAMGTPAFMSPEQARGDRDIGIASDVYALGATLYCLAVGSAPFEGATPWVVVAKVLNEPVPDPRAAVPALSKGFAAVVMRAMAKDVTSRYLTPDLLLGDLERLQSGKEPLLDKAIPGTATMRRGGATSVSDPSAASDRLSAPPRRGRGLIIAGGAALVVIAVVVVMLTQKPAAPNPASTTKPTPPPTPPATQAEQVAQVPIIKPTGPTPEMLAKAEALAQRLRLQGQAQISVKALADGMLEVAGFDARFKDLSILSGEPIQRLSVAGCKGISDLKPLTAVPIQALDLSGLSDLRDLAGVENMPLSELNLTGCADLRSIAQLKNKAIHTLHLKGCRRLAALTGIEDLPLQSLDMSGCEALSGDLLSLHKLALRTLIADGCTGLTSLDGINGMPLETLSLSGCRYLTQIRSIATLKKLRSLSLADCRNLEGAEVWRVIAGLPLTTLSLAGNDWVESLDGISTLKLTTLSLARCSDLSNVRGAASMPLSVLDLSNCSSLRSLSGLENVPLTSLNISNARYLKDDVLQPVLAKPGLKFIRN